MTVTNRRSSKETGQPSRQEWVKRDLVSSVMMSTEPAKAVGGEAIGGSVADGVGAGAAVVGATVDVSGATTVVEVATTVVEVASVVEVVEVVVEDARVVDVDGAAVSSLGAEGSFVDGSAVDD
ncbi:MAG: hypothetical protein R8J94_18110 [Acidimicrobiia bacterium]|nr:hypothetical protein [Acidimicrobiia bacterium]